MMPTLMDRKISKVAHGMPPTSTTCSLGKPCSQSRKTKTITAKHHDEALADQVTDNGHLNDWIDTPLNKNLWDDVIESWFEVACNCNVLERESA